MKITELVQDRAESRFCGEEKKKSSIYLAHVEERQSQSIGSTEEG